MRFSIITVCFNPGPLLQESMDSVHAQQGVEIEHIVIDGGSSDGTQERLQHVVPPSQVAFRYISEPDHGIYDALNKGLAMATGDVIGFVHADDFLSGPDSLRKMMALFAKDPQLDAVYGDLVYVDRRDASRVTRRWTSGVFSTKKLCRGWYPAHPSLYLKRGVFERYGLFDTSLRIAADVEFMMRIFSKDITAHYLPEVLVKMRAGGTTGKRQNILEQNRQVMAGMRKNGIRVSPLFWPLKAANRGFQFLKALLS